MDYFPTTMSYQFMAGVQEQNLDSPSKNNNNNSKNKSPNKKNKIQSAKQLPINFFERVIDLEMKLEREFHMSTLLELVNSYSVKKN